MVLSPGTQVFCGNDDCEVFCWDMTEDPQRFKATAMVFDLHQDWPGP